MIWNAFDAQDVTLEDFLAISVNKPDVLSDSFRNDLYRRIERFPVIDEEFPLSPTATILCAPNQISIHPLAASYGFSTKQNFSQL